MARTDRDSWNLATSVGAMATMAAAQRALAASGPHPLIDDPFAAPLVANARLALLGGGAYLRERLDAEPATPADLAKALKAMARTIDQLGINYLAGATSTAQDPLRSDLDKEVTAINKLCA
jgi:O-methyltransferase involved in polyketide biosynthesis